MSLKTTLATLTLLCLMFMSTLTQAATIPLGITMRHAKGQPLVEFYAVGPKITIFRIIGDNGRCVVYQSRPTTLMGKDAFDYTMCDTTGYSLRTLTVETDLGTATYAFPAKWYQPQ